MAASGNRMMQVQESLKRCGYVMFERGLAWSHSGNTSAKVGPKSFVISAAGSQLGYLNDEDLVLCHIDNDKYEGARPPSIEKRLHQRIYQTNEDAAVVAHTQPFYSTLVACSNMAIRTDLFPEAMAYLGKVERVPYHHAGSYELAEATAAKAQDSQVLLLENHGILCWGSSIEEVMPKTETLEFLCRLLVLSSAGGISLNYLGENTMKDFIQHLQKLGGLTA
jgi:L-fuculose-phosphate aldolase